MWTALVRLVLEILHAHAVSVADPPVDTADGLADGGAGQRAEAVAVAMSTIVQTLSLRQNKSQSELADAVC